MARRRPRFQPHLEPPSWYRSFDPAAWDEPGALEVSMTGGAEVRDWPGHEHHARLRWLEAKYAYERANPEFATQEFNAIRARRAERRTRQGW